jgi:hypothetical protein
MDDSGQRVLTWTETFCRDDRQPTRALREAESSVFPLQALDVLPRKAVLRLAHHLAI